MSGIYLRAIGFDIDKHHASLMCEKAIISHRRNGKSRHESGILEYYMRKAGVIN